MIQLYLVLIIKRRVLGVDLGVDNFATCLDNKSGRSFILNGKEMKSINCNLF